MKAFNLISIFLLLNLIHAQDNKHDGSSDKKDKIFAEAKQKFEDFENEHGHFISTPNAKVHYLTWGNPNDLPLIWSHGSFSNGYELLKIANDLVQAGYYFIAIDYYGHGQTTLPKQEVSLYNVADDISFLIDHLQIDKAVIGGWSRGGYISTAFYNTYPDKTLGLILEDGGSVATNFHYHQLDEDSLSSLITSFGVEKIFEEEGVFNTEREAFYSLYDESETDSQFQLLAWIREVEDNKWAANPGLFQLFHHSNTQQILDVILRPTKTPLFASSMSLMDPEVIFRNLDIPILIMDPVSDDDLFPFEQENKRLQEKYPELIDHKIYRNTGHNIHYEKPEEFVLDLTKFLFKIKKHHGM